jgi:ATP-dependent Clp protease protease subunit
MRASLRACGNIHALADESDIVIYDDIGYFGVSAREIHDRLRGADGGPVNVLINSYGGDVYDGIAIYNELLRYGGEINVRIMGIAASAASLIAMAGHRIEIGANAEIMIHNAWTIGWGNAGDMRAIAERLDQVDANLAATYAARTGRPADAIAAMMAEDTFLSGKAAVDLGFADAVIPLQGGADDEDEEEDEATMSASIASLRRLADTLTPVSVQP